MRKKKIIIGSLIITAVMAITWRVYDHKSGNIRYATGIYDHDINFLSNTNNSPDRFISTLQEQLVDNPGNSKLLTKLGAAYIQKARESNDPEFYSLAETMMKRAIDDDEENFLAIAGLGSVYLSRHKFKEALVLGNEALKINPYSNYTYGIVVDAQVELGMYYEAFTSVQKMVDLRPDLGSFSRVSYIRELRGDIIGAIEAMKSAITAGSRATENTAWCMVQLANLFYNAGDVQNSEHVFEYIIRVFPNYSHGYAGLAKICVFKKDYEKAIELYNKAVEKNSLPEYVIALGDAYFLKNEKEKALEQYQKVKFLITMSKEKGVDSDLELALFNADHNRYLNESLEEAERSLQNGSHSIKTYHTLAWVNYKLGNFEAAEKNIVQALRLGTKDPLMFFHAGKIYEKLGNTTKSKEYLGFALKINPHYEILYQDK